MQQALDELGLSRRRVIGSAPEALAAIARALVAIEANTSAAQVMLTVMGRPPDKMVIPWSEASIGGNSVTSMLTATQLHRLEARLRGLWPPGAGALGTAAALAAAVVPVRHALEVHELLVVRAVVVHHREQRDLVLGGGPQHAGRVHEVAVGLDADRKPPEVAVGDKDYEALNATGALAHYEKAIAADPRNFEAFWKASRSAVDIGSYSADASRRSTLFSSAERYARQAIALNPANAEGHFALARALGKTALAQSPRGRVKYATEVRSHALECLKINPKQPGCLHVMGMWNAEVMRLNGFTRMMAKNFLGGQVFGSASWPEAKRYMEESVANEPDRIAHHLDLAGVYRDMGDKTKALAEYQAVMKLPNIEADARRYNWLGGTSGPLATSAK